MGDRINNHIDDNPSTRYNAQLVDNPPKNYALSGKIMLSSIVILFAVVIFIVALHVYARWYLLRVRRRRNHHHRRRQLPAHIVFYVDPNSATPTGLDPSVISSLPVFSYSSQTHATALECAVCLSEFEDNENGRLLPKCQHYFHIDCIDMWFQSHSTCPLCRSAVEPACLVHAPINNQNDVVPSVGDQGETDPGSGSTSIPDQKKDLDPVGVTVEVPGRNELEDESRVNSQTTQVSRSAGTRMMSLKRMLSMNRKAAPAGSASAGIGTSCGNAVTESDLELGKDESTQVETRAHTPRNENVFVCK